MSVHLRVRVLVSALKPILVLVRYVPHEYSRVYKYSILTNFIPPYRYVDLKYMICAVYMIDLGH